MSADAVGSSAQRHARVADHHAEARAGAQPEPLARDVDQLAVNLQHPRPRAGPRGELVARQREAGAAEEDAVDRRAADTSRRRSRRRSSGRSRARAGVGRRGRRTECLRFSSTSVRSLGSLRIAVDARAVVGRLRVARHADRDRGAAEHDRHGHEPRHRPSTTAQHRARAARRARAAGRQACTAPRPSPWSGTIRPPGRERPRQPARGRPRRQPRRRPSRSYRDRRAVASRPRG